MQIGEDVAGVNGRGLSSTVGYVREDAGFFCYLISLPGKKKNGV